MTMKPILATPPDSREPRRRRRLKSLALLPTLLTLGNLLCGFAAIHFALRAVFDSGVPVADISAHSSSPTLMELTLPSFLSVGAGLILVGLVFDLLDGLAARMTRSTTNFGGQLDSLADVVTFGVAPAILMIALMMKKLAVDAIVPSPISVSFLGRLTWMSAALYVVFTAVRLARFNVEHAKADFDYRSFRGMPSPGAACVIAAMILCHDQPDLGIVSKLIVYALPIVAAVIAYLMVSRIPYRRFHHTYFLGKKPFGHVITVVLLFSIFWLYKAPVLLVLVLWYAASGPVFLAIRLVRERRGAVDLAVAPESPQELRRGA